jgi:RNA polymerase sigma factor (sigma-70 family)
MEKNEIIQHLFRTEYRKVVAVLCKWFGTEHIATAEDIASDTFLLAAETWGMKGMPANAVAWLYTVAKNKAKDVLKHDAIFAKKIAGQIRHTQPATEDMEEIDLSEQNIADSQLQMMFAICHPCIPATARIGLCLNILCGFSAEEIADAFLTGKETIYKRLIRAKEKLKTEKIKIELPPIHEVDGRLHNVLTTLYLLFNEGYYSSSQDAVVRKDLCLEAMRLNIMLVENERTNTGPVNALLALMCFHASRFEARVNEKLEIILYEQQDEHLWNQELMARGRYYLGAAGSSVFGKYHFEATIAYWHTRHEDNIEKWGNILDLYNRLLQMEYSPVAAMNRTYALAKVYGKEIAIAEAKKLDLGGHLYQVLLGYLYTDLDSTAAIQHLEMAYSLARSAGDKTTIANSIKKILGTAPLASEV